MELKPHFRVVRFSPVPEIQESVNVALLFVSDRARLVSDYEFQKLGCIAPNFDKSILRFWLEDIAEDLARIKPQDAFAHIASRSPQIQVGDTQWLTQQLSPAFESRLIDTYLHREPRRSKHADNHIHYVDTLIDDAITNPAFNATGMLRRAKPDKFLSDTSLRLLGSVGNIQFSRVKNGSNKIVIMDGLNLSVASKAQLSSRAATVGTGFYIIGNHRSQLEQIEQKKIVRAAFLFNRPPTGDPEISYLANVIRRDSDLLVEPETGINLVEIQRELQTSSINILV